MQICRAVTTRARRPPPAKPPPLANGDSKPKNKCFTFLSATSPFTSCNIQSAIRKLSSPKKREATPHEDTVHSPSSMASHWERLHETLHSCINYYFTSNAPPTCSPASPMPKRRHKAGCREASRTPRPPTPIDSTTNRENRERIVQMLEALL
eukprot:jgi/Botrbrau1/1712/Bobra.116_2s0054.1